MSQTTVIISKTKSIISSFKYFVQFVEAIVESTLVTVFHKVYCKSHGLFNEKQIYSGESVLC